MDLTQSLLQALQSMGTGTPESAAAIQRSNTADAQLNQQNSVMGSAKTDPREARAAQGPALSTIRDLVNLLNPIDWMGGMAGGGAAAHVPGTYRALGLERSGASGTLNPAQYLAKLQMEPNYERFKQLVQMFTKQALGESFPVARGAAQTDPLITAIQQGSRAPVTAVTHDTVGSNMFPTAERFAQSIAETSRKPSYVAQGTATPADVAAFVPRRGQYAGEAELILNPTAQFQPQLAGKYIPPSGSYPFVERKALDPIQEILSALAQAAQPPLR